MLARVHRLTTHRDFEGLYRRGERLSGKYVLIRLLPNRLSVTRVGVVMSTKAHKRATVRNIHKRQTRAIMRHLLPHLPHGWDIVVTIQRPVREHTEWPGFREELRNLFARRFSA